MTSLSRADLNNGTAVGPQGEGMDSPSNFSTYPAYKDSGIEWLGEVPEHWKEKPFFSLVSERCESNAGMKQENLLSLSYGRIVNKDINSLDGLLPASFETYQVVHPGDIVFRLTDLQNDKRSLRSAIVREAGIITSAYLAGVCRGIFPEFASFLFRAYDSIKVFYSMGGGLRQSMKYSDMKWLPIFLPEWQEQTQIARFLDHETARIDALIEEQQRLIELLKEKRQAVISHAVTKGLDPTVPMKDSGVEWLGEVPAHWVVSRAKLVSDIFVPQRNKPELNDSEGIPWVTMEDMNGGYISATNLKVTELAAREAGSKVLKKGAVIASCVGRFGIVAINAVDVVINQQLQAFEPRKIKAEYLRSIVSLSKEYFELTGTAATLVYVNQQGFENLPVLVPSAGEQESICLYIDEANARFDALLSQSFESIQLLQERRSALISAAVTGKIDVRGWQPPASTLAPKLEVAEVN